MCVVAFGPRRRVTGFLWRAAHAGVVVPAGVLGHAENALHAANNPAANRASCSTDRAAHGAANGSAYLVAGP